MIPTGMIILVVVAVLVYFGLAHRLLDRMRLTDKAALGIILAMILGGLINIRVTGRPNELILNVGGGLVPFALAIYLLATADEPGETARGVVGSLIAGALVYASSRLLPVDPEQSPLIDPFYVYAIIAGVVGYLAGRSRRAAFCAGVLGILLSDAAHFVETGVRRIPSRTWVGGAGAFDSVVIAGLLAVGLAEVVGEVRERLQGGTAHVTGEGGEDKGVPKKGEKEHGQDS